MSLASLGRHAHALRALRESANLTPSDPLPHWISARLCYEQLGLIEEGLNHSQLALKKEVKVLRPSRAQLYVGMGLQQMAITTGLKTERENYNRMALEAFEKAVQIDPNGHLSEYYLALQYAIHYNIQEALVHTKYALTLRTEHAPSLLLFAMLLTASRRTREALDIIEDSLEEFPDKLNLLHLKAHLQLHLLDPETALVTVQKTLGI